MKPTVEATPAENLSDGEVIDLVRRGETGCFSLLVTRYQGPLLAMAASRVGRRDLAEDVVQESFLCAFRWLDSYDSRFPFRTWLWTIVLNQCRRAMEKESRLTATLEAAAHERGEQLAETPANPAEHLEAVERGRRLKKALKAIPEAQADALRLRFFGGLQFDAIAQAMGCSLRAAKYRVKEGLLLLGKLLGAAEGVGLELESDREFGKKLKSSSEMPHAMR